MASSIRGWLLAVAMAGLSACAVRPPDAWKDYRSELEAVDQRCRTGYAESAALDPIRSKVQLWVSPVDASPPFAMLSDNTFPSEAERTAIQKWASMRDECLAERDRIFSKPVRMNGYVSVIIREDIGVARQQNAALTELIVALYEQKLTYGEFARKRHEIGSQLAQTLRDIDRSAVVHDEQLRAQAQALFAQNLQAWAAYMQAVNSRAPQTVYLTGSVQVTH